ncbi:MAG: N-acetyl-gamma-glutamyl-phosphate reductase [Betaproteobacteria bacterium]|nr:N-acetyl-gamma-glutamyl-phosphate reductase [Betaproteobacteria bacterium]
MAYQPIRIGIVGGTGYTGVELLRLLAAHPAAELAVITSRKDAGMPVSGMFPNLRGRVDLAFTEPDVKALTACDLVFFATPNGIAMQEAAELLNAGTRVIDLAADFRIKDIAEWERWYGMTHASPQLVAQAVYGLPEVNREAIRKALLVANPGCYPTAVSHPETRSVRGANTCRIAVHRPQGGDTVVVLSAIDNLVKGAAGQAVQNMNLMFGLPETLGIDGIALLP